MERLFRKHFWAINLVFIAAVALIAAETVSLFAASALTPLPSAPRMHSSIDPRPSVHDARLDMIAIANLLGLPVPKPEPTVKAPSRTFDPTATPVKTNLPVKLLGTLLASDPSQSLAALYDTQARTSGTYRVGDTIDGAKILEVKREQVIIENNDRREYIDDQPGNGAPVAQGPTVHMPRMAVASPSSGDLGSGIQSTGPNQYDVPRSTVDNALSHLNQLAMQARIVPDFRDGRSDGFKLFSIRPGSLYAKIGIINGDVLTRINGYELNSPEKALEVYQKLQNASHIDIEINRNGSIIHKSYDIQ